MRVHPDTADSPGAPGADRVRELLARAAERRFYGAFEEALDLCIESGDREGLRDLAHHAFEAMDYDVCIEALRVAEDVRMLLGIGEYLSAYSTQWGAPFVEAARRIRRERRRARQS